MSTLISQHDSHGETGRCDAKCYNAEQPVCICVCGGANHGVGFERAMTNTDTIAQELAENLTSDIYPQVHDIQLPLF